MSKRITDGLQLPDALILIGQLDAKILHLEQALDDREAKIKELKDRVQAFQLGNVHHDKPRNPMCS